MTMGRRDLQVRWSVILVIVGWVLMHLAAVVQAAGDVSDASFRFQYERVELEEDPRWITDLEFVPGTSEFFLAHQPNHVKHYRLEGDGAALLGSFTIPGQEDGLLIPTQCGVYVALPPDFEDSGIIYAGHCPDYRESVIHAYDLSGGHQSAPASAEEILRVGWNGSGGPWHNLGSFEIDADGVMWALFGEKTNDVAAQDPHDLLGSLVRVIPDPVNGGYTIPAGNPFNGVDGASEVYSYGLRTPWRGTLDHLGRYWIGDVGSNDQDIAVEEVNLVDRGGLNFGWPLWEGPCESDCDGLTDPLVSLPHPEAHSIWVGMEFPLVDGSDPYGDRLDGSVLYGDYYDSWVRLIETDEDGEVQSHRLVESGEDLRQVTAMDQGEGGHLYLTTYGEVERPAGLWRVQLELWDPELILNLIGLSLVVAVLVVIWALQGFHRKGAETLRSG